MQLDHPILRALLLFASVSNHLIVESAQAGTIVNLVPTNVTVTALSVTSALVTWSLMDLGSPVNGNGGQHHHQHHQPSEESPGSQQQHHHGSQQRIEITYRPVQDRQRMIIPVPVEVTSYVLRDLRPGGAYTVSVSSISKGHGRIRSPPVQLFMLPTTSGTPAEAADPPPLMPPPPLSHHRRPAGPYYGSSSPGVVQHSSSDVTDYYGSNTSGIVLVRGEEVGIVVLVLFVWVGAVALFFHRWGKIRMLLPYQPVFKEEVPAIAAMNVGCSPSPTLHGQQLQHQSSLQSTGSPAVLVSANKFVSLDPAAMRRNQFMLHSRLARMRAIAEKRHCPPTSMSRLESSCVIVGRTSPKHQQQPIRQQAYAGRRANTIASAGDDLVSRSPFSSRRGPRHHRILDMTGSGDSTASMENPEQNPKPQYCRRKARSAEVITLTVTECDTESPTNSNSSGTAGGGAAAAAVESSSGGTELPERSKTSSMDAFLQQYGSSRTAECAL